MILLPTSYIAKAIVAALVIVLPTQCLTTADLLILPHLYTLAVVKEVLIYLKMALRSTIIVPIRTNFN